MENKILIVISPDSHLSSFGVSAVIKEINTFNWSKSFFFILKNEKNMKKKKKFFLF